MRDGALTLDDLAGTLDVFVDSDAQHLGKQRFLGLEMVVRQPLATTCFRSNISYPGSIQAPLENNLPGRLQQLRTTNRSLLRTR